MQCAHCTHKYISMENGNANERMETGRDENDRKNATNLKEIKTWIRFSAVDAAIETEAIITKRFTEIFFFCRISFLFLKLFKDLFVHFLNSITMMSLHSLSPPCLFLSLFYLDESCDIVAVKRLQ